MRMCFIVSGVQQGAQIASLYQYVRVRVERCDLSVLGAAVAGVYRASGYALSPMYALAWGVGQTIIVIFISFTRILATLWNCLWFDVDQWWHSSRSCRKRRDGDPVICGLTPKSLVHIPYSKSVVRVNHTDVLWPCCQRLFCWIFCNPFTSWFRGRTSDLWEKWVGEVVLLSYWLVLWAVDVRVPRLMMSEVFFRCNLQSPGAALVCSESTP